MILITVTTWAIPARIWKTQSCQYRLRNLSTPPICLFDLFVVKSDSNFVEHTFNFKLNNETFRVSSCLFLGLRGTARGSMLNRSVGFHVTYSFLLQGELERDRVFGTFFTLVCGQPASKQIDDKIIREEFKRSPEELQKTDWNAERLLQFNRTSIALTAQQACCTCRDAVSVATNGILIT